MAVGPSRSADNVLGVRIIGFEEALRGAQGACLPSQLPLGGASKPRSIEHVHELAIRGRSRIERMFHRLAALAVGLLLVPMIASTASAATVPTVLGDSIA